LVAKVILLVAVTPGSWRAELRFRVKTALSGRA